MISRAKFAARIPGRMIGRLANEGKRKEFRGREFDRVLSMLEQGEDDRCEAFCAAAAEFGDSSRRRLARAKVGGLAFTAS